MHFGMKVCAFFGKKKRYVCRGIQYPAKGVEGGKAGPSHINSFTNTPLANI